MTTHHLSDLDEEARTATCSLCGNVDIHKTRISTATGKQLWSCSGKLTTKKHVHRLSDLNEDDRTAVCSNCGVVKIVKNGVYKGKTLWKCRIKRQEFDISSGRQDYLEDWIKNNPEKRSSYVRKTWLKQAYGITVEEYERMLEAQGGVCGICGKSGDEKFLSVDHDHETNRIRGLACRNCNAGLGNFKDKIENLESAIAYLKDHKGREKLAWLME